jgi:hypothetical protein
MLIIVIPDRRRPAMPNIWPIKHMHNQPALHPRPKQIHSRVSREAITRVPRPQPIPRRPRLHPARHIGKTCPPAYPAAVRNRAVVAAVELDHGHGSAVVAWIVDHRVGVTPGAVVSVVGRVESARHGRDGGYSVREHGVAR